jgi:hypothetical protein
MCGTMFQTQPGIRVAMDEGKKIWISFCIKQLKAYKREVAKLEKLLDIATGKEAKPEFKL